MSNDHKAASRNDLDFSFGVRELRNASVAQALRLNAVPVKAANEKQGFDPYNTSGSFDRKKNWARIGKR